jgi:hypothetical protein
MRRPEHIAHNRVEKYIQNFLAKTLNRRDPGIKRMVIL